MCKWSADTKKMNAVQKKRGYGRRRKLDCGSRPLDNTLITTSKAADSEQTHDESFEGFKTLHNTRHHPEFSYYWEQRQK